MRFLLKLLLSVSHRLPCMLLLREGCVRLELWLDSVVEGVWLYFLSMLNLCIVLQAISKDWLLALDKWSLCDLSCICTENPFVLWIAQTTLMLSKQWFTTTWNKELLWLVSDLHPFLELLTLVWLPFQCVRLGLLSLIEWTPVPLLSVEPLTCEETSPVKHESSLFDRGI